MRCVLILLFGGYAHANHLVGFIVIALLRQKFWVAQAKPSLSGSAHIHMILECFVGSAVPYVAATFMLLMFVFYPGPEEVLFRTAIMAVSPFLVCSFMPQVYCIHAPTVYR